MRSAGGFRCSDGRPVRLVRVGGRLMVRFGSSPSQCVRLYGGPVKDVSNFCVGSRGAVTTLLARVPGASFCAVSLCRLGGRSTGVLLEYGGIMPRVEAACRSVC